MKAVILCGGLGTRLREETEFRPQPMVEIGGRPILMAYHEERMRTAFANLCCVWDTAATPPKSHVVHIWRFEPIRVEPDRETESELRIYISRGVKSRMRALIQQWLLPGPRMIVWGVGTNTLRRLVASNPKYRQELRGAPIVSPGDLKFSMAIHDQIQRSFGLKNPLILLYGREGMSHRLDELVDNNRMGLRTALEEMSIRSSDFMNIDKQRHTREDDLHCNLLL